MTDKQEKRLNELLDKAYNSEKWNPGNDKRKIVKLSKGNLLDINVCMLSGCKCGWNIKIGSNDYKLLFKILDLLGGIK